MNNFIFVSTFYYQMRTRVYEYLLRPLYIFFFIWSVFLGCASTEPDNEPVLVDEKYKLSSDRQAFDEIRKDVPTEKKQENDELALILSLTQEVKDPPQKIRDRFDTLLRKKRSLFQKDMDKSRDQFSKNEKKSREAFNKEQEKLRKDFGSQKHNREESQEFYLAQEDRSKEYNSQARESRDNFEEEMRAKRKNFDDYAKEKSNEFNQEMKSYTKRYEEWKKQKATEKLENESKKNELKEVNLSTD